LFAEEIVAVTVGRGAKLTALSEDEHIRHGLSLEALAALRPAFRPSGSVTAGSASGINDGAAALLLLSETALQQAGLTPLARVVSWASAGVDPAVMGLGPVPAVRQALRKAGWSTTDVELWELNEAFAAQSLAVMQELDLDPAVVNVQGGAIALGHPIGASGARILVTLLHALRRRGARRGL